MQLNTYLTRLCTATALIACATHCGPGNRAQAGDDQNTSLAASNRACNQAEGCATSTGTVQNTAFTPQVALFTSTAMSPNAVVPDKPFDPNTAADSNNVPAAPLLVIDSSAGTCGAAGQGHTPQSTTRLTFALTPGDAWQVGTYAVGAPSSSGQTKSKSVTRAAADPNAGVDPNALIPSMPVGPTPPPADSTPVGDPNASPIAPAALSAKATLTQTGASCAPVSSTELSGTLTLSAVSATQIKGTYELTSATGEKLQGTLDAVSCPALGDKHLTCAP